MKPEQTKDKLTIFIKIVSKISFPMKLFSSMISVVIFMVYEVSNIGSKDIVEIDQREIDARILMQEMASGQP